MSEASHSPRPPKGHSWGERTIQARGGEQYAPADWHTDADEMNRRFGFGGPLDVEEWTELHGHKIVYPDMMIHERRAERTPSNKGTDCLHLGDRDSGKTTLALYEAWRMMAENGEKVIWRGRYDGSGWLPYKHWATVFLPEYATIDPAWMNEGDEPDEEARQDLDPEQLDAIARDVVYYEDVFDLLDKLGEQPPGTFNVVYPDPSFNGCDEVVRQSRQISDPWPWVPEWDADEDTPPTPRIDWWFAFILARKDFGPYEWMTLFFDECGDFVPEYAKNDPNRRLHDKIHALRKVWAASRKRYLSLFFFGHHAENVHHEIRREFKWHVQMPDGSANPVKHKRSTHPLGMKGDITANVDVMSKHKTPGVAFCFSKKGDTRFKWDDVPPEPEDAERWLRIDLLEPDALPERDDETEAELAYDEWLFTEYESPDEHRLYVNGEAGNGAVSLPDGRVIQPLESRAEGIEFPEQPVRRQGEHLEVVVREDGEFVVVARIPKPKAASRDSSAGGAGR